MPPTGYSTDGFFGWLGFLVLVGFCYCLVLTAAPGGRRVINTLSTRESELQLSVSWDSILGGW